jgi:hypothetical protein
MSATCCAQIGDHIALRATTTGGVAMEPITAGRLDFDVGTEVGEDHRRHPADRSRSQIDDAYALQRVWHALDSRCWFCRDCSPGGASRLRFEHRAAMVRVAFDQGERSWTTSFSPMRA